MDVGRASIAQSRRPSEPTAVSMAFLALLVSFRSRIREEIIENRLIPYERCGFRSG